MKSVVEALDDVRGRLRYRLKPPYTEIVESQAGLRLKADEDERLFTVEFTARLYLHYASVQTGNEGLVFSVRFSGTTTADSPSPPVNELFAEGLVDSFEVHGYGRRWEGQAISTPEELIQKLEIPTRTLNRLSIQEFLKKIG